MRMRPDQVPEPSQPSRSVSLGIPGAVGVDMPVPVPKMPGLVDMRGLLHASSARGTRLRISHDIQDAWNIRLQHVNNSQPGANAKHPQSGQAGTSSSLSRGRPRIRGLAPHSLIAYRRLTMNSPEPLDRETADTYAAWFKALADGTRVQVVSLLARSGVPLTVKQIVAAVPVGQSTVSEHLRQLAAVGFVLAENRGTSRLYRINEEAVNSFPTAADLIMGKPSPVPPPRAEDPVP